MTTHGLSKGRAYAAWKNAKFRCYNPRAKNFSRYGGRGIAMCAEWRHDFEAFRRDLGECPVGLSLDRINNDGHYEPGNCRWATALEQANNRGSRSKPETSSAIEAGT